MAEERSSAVIIAIKSFGHDGLDVLKRAVRAVNGVAHINQCSSAYRAQASSDQTDHIHDLRTQNWFFGYIVAVQLFTQMTPEQLSNQLRQIENEIVPQTSQNGLKISILLFGNQTQMTPNLTLPYPEMHLLPEFLVPAAEIGPNQMHPVFKKPLRALAAELSPAPWGEFIAQGKAMLDF